VTANPFTFVPPRIRVLQIESVDLSPIEVSESNVYERVRAVRQELANESQNSIMTLRMILQGSLMLPPDVGHYAIMRTFFATESDEGSYPRHLVQRLVETMMQFEIWNKIALDKAEAFAVQHSPQTLPLIEELKKSYGQFKNTLNSYPVVKTLTKKT